MTRIPKQPESNWRPI